MAPSTPEPSAKELARKALQSSVRKDLQAAAKATGVIKANGTNLSMMEQLNVWLNNKEPSPSAKPRSPAPSPSSTVKDAATPDCPPSCLSLGISGLKDSSERGRRDSSASGVVSDLAECFEAINVDDEAGKPAPLGSVENVLGALPTERPGKEPPAIAPTGPAAAWAGTHIRFD